MIKTKKQTLLGETIIPFLIVTVFISIPFLCIDYEIREFLREQPIVNFHFLSYSEATERAL